MRMELDMRGELVYECSVLHVNIYFILNFDLTLLCLIIAEGPGFPVGRGVLEVGDTPTPSPHVCQNQRIGSVWGAPLLDPPLN